MTAPDPRRATWIGAVAVPLWAMLAWLDRHAVRLPPLQVVAMAFAVAAALSFAAALALRRDPVGALRQPPAAWALGVGGLAGYHVLYFLAFRLGPTLRVEINLLNYLWPLGIVLLSALLPGHGLRARHVGGALLGFGGTAALLGAAPSADVEALPAYLAAVGAAATWSVYSVLARRFAQVPTDAVSGFCLATAVVAGVAHVALEPTVRPDAGELLAVVTMGALPLGAAFFAWDHGCKHGDLRALGVLAYATPLLSTLLLVTLGDARPAGTVWLGAALVVGGAVVAGRG